jgi:hypothetical protein
MRASATLVLDIQVFEPFMSQWSPLSWAVDFMAMTSDPALGSVMPKPPMYSALTSLEYIFLNSSVPYRKS